MTQLNWFAWVPSGVLALGLAVSSEVSTPVPIPLVTPLEESLGGAPAGYVFADVPIPEEELAVAGVSDYLNRVYDLETTDEPPSEVVAESSWFSLYVGYYDHQVRGHTIHSPKNCLPGAGWDALDASLTTLNGPNGPRVTNRYLLQRGEERVVAYYWYQGRGRFQADEFKVKWHLLWDSAFTGRTEEALVRVVVPLYGDNEAAADELAARIVRWTMPRLQVSLP